MCELIIEAKTENMDIVQNFINSHIQDCPPKIQHQIAIAVDEIFSNIANYAYQPGTGDSVVRIKADCDITIEFEDSGVAYNPLSAPEPDVTLSTEERDIGGVGIFMVKKIMDSMEYHRRGNKNILIIKKKLL